MLMLVRVVRHWRWHRRGPEGGGGGGGGGSVGGGLGGGGRTAAVAVAHRRRGAGSPHAVVGSCSIGLRNNIRMFEMQ